MSSTKLSPCRAWAPPGPSETRPVALGTRGVAPAGVDVQRLRVASALVRMSAVLARCERDMARSSGEAAPGTSVRARKSVSPGGILDRPVKCSGYDHKMEPRFESVPAVRESLADA